MIDRIITSVYFIFFYLFLCYLVELHVRCFSKPSFNDQDKNEEHSAGEQQLATASSAANQSKVNLVECRLRLDRIYFRL